MRILILNWRDIRHPQGGGAEVFTQEIAERFVKQGHEVDLFTAAFPGCENEEHINGVRVKRRGGTFGVYYWGYRYVRENGHEYDIIVDEVNARPFFAHRAVRSSRPRVITLIHQLMREYWYYEYPTPIAAVAARVIEPWWLRQIRNVPTIAVSDSTLSDLQALGFSRLFLISEGLNVEPLPSVPVKAETPVLLYVGRLKRTKRPDHALLAFDMVRQQIPQAQMWVIGDGPMRPQLERSTPQGVTFYGRISKEQKERAVSQAHVLLVPSVREGWGLVVTEAGALGTPAVGYDVHGLRDSIRHGATGLLVDAGQPRAMAEAALQLLQNQALRSKLTAGALEWCRTFSWDRTAEEFLAIATQVR